ncbi:hypothetical protein D3C72_2413550 [compost metagenome]
MEPSALAAFSAPMTVRVEPSLAASSADTAARADPEAASASEAASRVRANFILLFSSSEPKQFANQKVVLRVR